MPKGKIKPGALKVFGRVVRVVGAVVAWGYSEGVAGKIIAARDPDSDGGTKVTIEEARELVHELTDEESINDLRARMTAALEG